jgi:hypothetical protein
LNTNFDYTLNNYKVSVIQNGQCVIVVYDDGNLGSLKNCSKIFTQKEKADKAVFKIKQHKMCLEDLVRIANSTLAQEKLPKYKFHENQKRYQDKRTVEKLFSEYKAINYKGSQPHIVTKLKKQRSLELLVPVEVNIDNKPVLYWVRESKLLEAYWVDKLGIDKAMFLLLRTKNTLKNHPERLLNSPNRNYIETQILNN